MINKTGVYRIKNKVDGKFYYGSAANSFKGRWATHISSLKNNVHKNKYLQAAWNKYGQDNFEFSIILLCDSKNCLYFEQLFLDKYWDNGTLCYNANKSVKIEENWLGRKHSAKSIEKIRLAKLGKPSGRLGKEHLLKTKIKISEAKKGKSPWNKGKSTPMEVREKQSIAKRGNKNPFYGKKHSAETKIKMAGPKNK